MKFRTGFVSNSSTSSFCILGFCVTKEELANIFPQITNEEDSLYDYSEELGKLGLELQSCNNDGEWCEWYAGIDIEGMSPEQLVEAANKIKSVSQFSHKSITVITAAWSNY